METMKAVRIYEYGGRDMLHYEDAPCPEVAQDEVLIRLAATSVNPFDWAARNGYVASYYTYSFPLILGLDVAGTIEGIGSEVQGFSVGDEVYARADPAKNGAYASYIALPAALVARKPASLDLIQSAAVPHAAFSAWSALIGVAKLASGQTVLIHAAAGGVGTFAVQLAKWRGARVIGTGSAQNLDFLRDLGADEVIDHENTRFEDVVRDVDVVLDLVGDMPDNTQTRSWKVIKPGGILASLVQFPSPEAAAEHHVRGSFVSADACSGQWLDEFGALIDGGQVSPVVSTVLPLEEVRLAHEKSEGRHVRGKIVMQIDGKK